MALDTTDTIKGLIYEGVAFPLDDGQDMLQARVDGDNSCAYLFYNYGSAELPDISRLDTSNVTNMRNMFAGAEKAEIIDVSNFETSNVENMHAMFNVCRVVKTLDLRHFNTAKVTDIGYIFSGNYALENILVNTWDTSNLIIANNAFTSCPITTLNLNGWDTSKVVNIARMVSDCKKLTTIQGTIDLYSATDLTDIFYYTSKLTGVTLKNIRRSLQIGSRALYGNLWELPYLVNAIKELWDLSSGSQQTLTIGSANLEKIANTYVKLITPTAEQIEADPYINNKLPCEVCESTDEGAMTLTAYAGLKNWGLA